VNESVGLQGWVCVRWSLGRLGPQECSREHEAGGCVRALCILPRMSLAGAGLLRQNPVSSDPVSLVNPGLCQWPSQPQGPHLPRRYLFTAGMLLHTRTALWRTLPRTSCRVTGSICRGEVGCESA
jgi:hypothetical protein